MKAGGVTKNENLTVRANQITEFKAWNVTFEVSAASGVEWHSAMVRWHDKILVHVGARDHAQVLRLLKEHLSRLDGYLDMVNFVTRLDSSSVIDSDPVHNPE